MSLTCTCSDYEGEGWYYTPPNDVSKLKTSKRKRCSSCNELIDIEASCYEFKRYRCPQNEIEERIYRDGAEIELASFYMCEKCGDQYMNLEDLGFCIDICENMFDLLEEYIEEYGPVKEAK
jgi:predicted RNA-binding Zn-ribbon protein involved in translation (DUF1610 family)